MVVYVPHIESLKVKTPRIMYTNWYIQPYLPLEISVYYTVCSTYTTTTKYSYIKIDSSACVFNENHNNKKTISGELDKNRNNKKKKVTTT